MQTRRAIVHDDAIETFCVFSLIDARDNEKIEKVVPEFVTELD